jgi:hemerythrin-like metal-binding protein
MNFTWDSDLETGIHELDYQHKRLFRFFHTLMAAVENKHTRTALSGFVGFITKHVDEHFGYEESLMLKTGYPDYLAHKIAHDEMRREVAELVESYRAKGHDPLVLIRMSTLASEWMRKHIFGVDFKLTSWLKKHPVPEG